jgi:hypothetical protein
MPAFAGMTKKGDRELQPLRGEWHLYLAEEGFRHVGMDLRASSLALSVLSFCIL